MSQIKIVCCRVVIIDGPDSWAKNLVNEKVIEKFYPVDFTDEAAIFDKCLARVKQAEKVISLLLPFSQEPSSQRHVATQEEQTHEVQLDMQICYLLQGC